MVGKTESQTVEVAELTTCSVREQGETIALGFRDGAGNDVSVRLAFRHAEALSMTLPNLLSHALTAKTKDPSARFVFGLGSWTLEDAGDGRHLIMTLETEDGFKVSFAIQTEACPDLGQALTRASGNPEPGVAADRIHTSTTRFN